MKPINKFTLPLAAFALVATGAVGTYAYQSHAQTATAADSAQIQSTSRENPMSSLIKAIASKFNLNESDVQQVFDDNRASMEAEHKQMEANRLAQAVSDGKLTQDQADKITAKQAELQSQREANKTKFDSLTVAERQAAMKTQMDELKQWATDNNIPQEYLPFGGGHGGPDGHRGGPKGDFQPAN